MSGKTKKAIHPKQVRGLKLLGKMLRVLEPLSHLPVHGNRQLLYQQYVALLLLGYYNPLLDSLRSLQRATELDKVQRALGIGRTSLGSLSQSAREVFDPRFLEEILQDVAQQVQQQPSIRLDQRLKDLSVPILAADGSFLRCLPSMVWALFRHQSHHRGVKLHVQLEVGRGLPVQVDVTHANGNERKVLLKRLKEAVLYVMDRGYVDYRLYQAIHDAGSLFVARLKSHCDSQVLDKRLLSNAAIRAGVLSDQWVQLGSSATEGQLAAPVRRIVIRAKDGSELILLSNSDLDVELIALIYRWRWQVELFFKWFKCILGCGKHWINRSENGLTLQVYVAMLASMLLSLWTGAKPNKAAFQMICLYLQGWASEAELTRYLRSLPSACSPAAALPALEFR